MCYPPGSSDELFTPRHHKTIPLTVSHKGMVPFFSVLAVSSLQSNQLLGNFIEGVVLNFRKYKK